MRRSLPASPRRARGAAAIVLVVLLLAILSAVALSVVLEIDPEVAAHRRSGEALAMSGDALEGHGRARYCAQTPPPTQLLPCPAPDDLGVAAASCTPPTTGALPWRTLGLPALRDHDARTLAYTLASGTTARLVAGQSEGTQTLTLALDLSALALLCPPPPAEPPPPEDPPPVEEPPPVEPEPEDPPTEDPPPVDPPPEEPEPEDPPPSPPPPPPPLSCQQQADILLDYVSGRDNLCRVGASGTRPQCAAVPNGLQSSGCSNACRQAAREFLEPPCINNLNPRRCQEIVEELEDCR